MRSTPALLGEPNRCRRINDDERQRHEQGMDDELGSLPKLTSEDIQKMPLRVKYTELTGKTAPAARLKVRLTYLLRDSPGFAGGFQNTADY